MILIKIILRKIKYYIFLVQNVLFNTRKYKGYNSLLLNNSIIKKTLAYNNQKFFIEKDINIKRTIKFINYIKKKKLKKIIDFGGGAGYHYFIAKKIINYEFKWFLIENKTMVKLCKKKIKYKNLSFNNQLIKTKADIFFSSCAINYTNNPINILNKISKLNAKYLYFTRTPLSQNGEVEFKQLSLLSENGPLYLKNEKKIFIECKNKIISQKKFENIFNKKYRIVKKYIDEKKAFYNAKKYYDNYTYIFKKI
jgi:putative methyltransferase (TIGR04325 family)